MAWMAIMDDDVVERYTKMVLASRGHCLSDYTSRGETPLVWGGSGAAALGLTGTVGGAQYRAIYRVGGAVHPGTGDRLTTTRRPGLELAIAPHKSVAVLGVLGRAEDMHTIMDAERNATLAYLDDLTRERGSRRGRDNVPSPTHGLIHATCREPASRAGDPNPTDHVLLANVVRMADHRGGYKAPSTFLWRDHLHAATMVGRMAGARRAVELGYAIVADDGPSGHLGHWAVAGVPQAVLRLFSKRSSAIDAEVRARGYQSYQGRQAAARITRQPKLPQGLDDLMVGWRAEMDSIGHGADVVLTAVVEAAARRPPVADRFSPAETEGLVERLLAPDGRLARRKVFSRLDVIVVATPPLYGLLPGEMCRVVDAVLAGSQVRALPRVGAASEAVFSTTCVADPNRAYDAVAR